MDNVVSEETKVVTPKDDTKDDKKDDTKDDTKDETKEDKYEAPKKGRLHFSFEIVPWAEVDKDKVGEGRSEPNQNPKLPEPMGRLKFSLNPYQMLK